MDIPVVRPRALKPGDTVGVIAPAGPVENRDAFLAGVAAIERLGFRVKYSDRIFESRGYLAGPDTDRAGELMNCFEDREVRAIVPLRGGYGCARLIPCLDEARLRHHPKVFMGFSDLTTLHLFFRRRFGWVTLHGPMMVSPALANLSSAAERHLLSLWTDPGYLPSYGFPELEPLGARGCRGEACRRMPVAADHEHRHTIRDEDGGEDSLPGRSWRTCLPAGSHADPPRAGGQARTCSRRAAGKLRRLRAAPRRHR